MNHLPAKLLKLRKHYNYSQARLAEVLNVDVVDYMAYENGRKVLNYEQCKKLARLYHIGISEIFANTEEVTLYDVTDASTDELNIEFFIPPKTFKDRFFDFVLKYKLIVGVALGIVVLGLIVIFVFAGQTAETPVEEEVLQMENQNRLAVSDTTVVYIDQYGAVKGAGDNTNGQISNLPGRNAIKVQEGKDFTIILNNDGSVKGIGLSPEEEQELEEWQNIIDIAAGDSHILGLSNEGKVYALGNDDYGQCEVSDYKDITKIYAFKNAGILIDTEGKVSCVGEMIGSSQLKNNILAIDAASDMLVLLNDDQQIEYFAESNSFYDIYKWKDVIDVVCGNDFIAGLTQDGYVLLDSDDTQAKQECENWSGIIAIAAADNYLIAYDGETIYGIGSNDYHQFVKEEKEKIRLAQVSDVSVSIGNTINVSFEKVANASGYEVKLDAGEGTTYPVSSNQTVSFNTEGLEEGKEYHITVTSLGDQLTYLDSDPLEVAFTYTREEKEENTYIDIDVDFQGMKVSDLEAYLASIGITDITPIESSQTCDDACAIVLSVDGLSKGQRIAKSELKNAKVTYSYCRLPEKEEDTSDEE